MFGYEIREPGSIPVCVHVPIFSRFLSYVSILMLNDLILVKCYHQSDRNGHFRTFYIELCMAPIGWVKICPTERELVR